MSDPKPVSLFHFIERAEKVHAPCMGEDRYNWQSNDPHVSRYAAQRCRRDCPMVLFCRQWAKDTGQRGGTWGGVTDNERGYERLRRMEERRQARIAKVAADLAAREAEDERIARFQGGRNTQT